MKAAVAAGGRATAGGRTLDPQGCRVLGSGRKGSASWRGGTRLLKVPLPHTQIFLEDPGARREAEPKFGYQALCVEGSVGNGGSANPLRQRIGIWRAWVGPGHG